MKMVMSMKRMLMESHKIQTQTYTMSFRARHTRNTRATTFTLKRLFQCMISGKVSTTCSQFHIYFILTVNTYWYHLHTNSIKHSFSRGHLVFLTCCMYGSGIHKFGPSIVLQNSYAALKFLLVTHGRRPIYWWSYFSSSFAFSSSIWHSLSTSSHQAFLLFATFCSSFRVLPI